MLLFFTLSTQFSCVWIWESAPALQVRKGYVVEKEGPTLFNYINNSPAVSSGENIPPSARGAQKLKSERIQASKSERASRFISGNKTLMMHAAVFARGPDQSC